MPGETDLETIYPEIAAEWDYENNSGKPTEYLPFSNKKVYWICPICHQSYLRKICDRTLTRMGCPQCMNPGERSTSQQEQMFVFYLSKVTEVQNRAKILGLEIDAFLPELNAGIEYHGEYYHLKRANHDAEKEAALMKHGIRLITVKCGRERNVSEDTIVMQTKFKENPSISELEWAVRETLSLLVLPEPDIDLQRDLSAIYAQYIRTIKSNNLSARFPEIAADWNTELNHGMTPEMFAYGSNKRVWWTCSVCGNDYDMKIGNRTVAKMGCPYCAGKRVKAGFNDLATTHPIIAKEWDTQRNHLTPQQITKGSGRKAWWICGKCGYNYLSAISSRTAGKGCPVCAGKIVIKGINDLESQRPDLLVIWNYDRNEIRPSEVTVSANRKAWWKCNQCGHEWEAVIGSVSAGCRCPECAKKNRPIGHRKTLLKKRGSFAEQHPELLDEWDYERNEKKPEEHLVGSTQKVHWVCKTCGHQWTMSIYCRTKQKQGCPKCGREKSDASRHSNILARRGTLADHCPELLAEWNYDKNEKGPECYTKGSQEEVWWKCSKGHSWHAQIYTRAHLKSGCPKCAGRLRCVNLDTGEVFENYTAAAKSVDVTRKAITFAIKNGTRCKGYRWGVAET